MAYCTADELTQLIAEIYDDVIAQSDREINAYLRAAGLTPPTSDEMLKAASMNLSRATILSQLSRDSSGAKVEAVVRQMNTYIDRAWASVDAYIAANRTDPALPIGIIVGREGARIGEFEEMTTAQEDVY